MSSSCVGASPGSTVGVWVGARHPTPNEFIVAEPGKLKSSDLFALAETLGVVLADHPSKEQVLRRLDRLEIRNHPNAQIIEHPKS